MFDKIFAALATKGGKPDQLMIDATHLKAHRTAASLLKKGLDGPMIPRIIGCVSLPRRIGRTKGSLNAKLHAIYDGNGQPLVMAETIA